MKIQNTLSGELNEVADGNPIGVYVCGVTPYDSAHVGHAMSLMVYDVLIRYLRWSGQEVNFVSNYTDVDDKLIDRAKNCPSIQLNWRIRIFCNGKRNNLGWAC